VNARERQASGAIPLLSDIYGLELQNTKRETPSSAESNAIPVKNAQFRNEYSFRLTHKPCGKLLASTNAKHLNLTQNTPERSFGW
jgi:hypothetical protein